MDFGQNVAGIVFSFMNSSDNSSNSGWSFPLDFYSNHAGGGGKKIK